MVILSVSVCNKKGKILLARQYVPMSRLRIEGLLAAFPKLIESDERSTSKQHTFIETNEVRYIYQPMDALYLLLITNMQSNILEDLSTLRMIAKLVPEYCGGHDEESVADNAFNLLYALDEVVTPMGYKESVTYKQIDDYVKMDSAEEKLSEIIEKSKLENAKDIMDKKAKEFDKRRRDEAQRAGSPNTFGYKGLGALSSLKTKFGGTGSHELDLNSVNAISSESYQRQFGDDNAGNLVIEQHGRKKYGGNHSDSDNETSSRSKNKKRSPMKGMNLSKKKHKDKLTKDVEVLDQRTMGSDQYRKFLEKASKGGNDEEELIDAADLPPVEILISEKLFVSFDRDGALKKFEIKGDMEVAVNDPSSTQCVIVTNINPKKSLSFGKPTWRLHPRMDANEWKKGILCLKDKQKKFRVGRSSKTSILKWRMSTDNDEQIPITIEFWPEAESNGSVTVTAQYSSNDEVALKNVIITFPMSCSREPEVNACDHGDTVWNKQHGEFQWILEDLEGGSQGSLEFVVDDVQLEDLYPVSIHFEIENNYSQIEIQSAHDADDQDKEITHSVKGSCVAEKYIVESS